VGKRILVIEPSRTLRAIFALNVPQGGHQVVLFKDYEAALVALPRFHEHPPDLAFVALYADRPESAQAVMRLRAFCPQATLIIMITQEEGSKLVVRRIAKERNPLVLLLFLLLLLYIFHLLQFREKVLYRLDTSIALCLKRA